MASLCYIIILFCFLSHDVLCKKHKHHVSKGGKIVGGYDTTIEDAPYQVYLLLKDGDDYYQCGGSIISNSVILTAAHCLTDIEEVFVRVGSTDADSGGTEFSTTDFEHHPDYDEDTTDFDVGVIRLSDTIDIDDEHTRIIEIADEGTEVEPGTNILVTGWGTTSENGDVSETLMAVQIPTVSNEDCNDAYGQITSNMFCAGLPEGGKDSCQGDSGGPAVSTDTGVQLGIVSFGVGCAQPGYPGVYTNIASVREWIRSASGV